MYLKELESKVDHLQTSNNKLICRNEHLEAENRLDYFKMKIHFYYMQFIILLIYLDL